MAGHEAVVQKPNSTRINLGGEKTKSELISTRFARHSALVDPESCGSITLNCEFPNSKHGKPKTCRDAAAYVSHMAQAAATSPGFLNKGRDPKWRRGAWHFRRTVTEVETPEILSS